MTNEEMKMLLIGAAIVVGVALAAGTLGGGFVGAAAVGGAICGALFGIAGGVEILKNTDGWKSFFIAYLIKYLL